MESKNWVKANMGTVLVFRPNGSSFDCGISQDDYEARVSALEAEGCDRSDAQAIVDAKLLREVKA